MQQACKKSPYLLLLLRQKSVLLQSGTAPRSATAVDRKRLRYSRPAEPCTGSTDKLHAAWDELRLRLYRLHQGYANHVLHLMLSNVHMYVAHVCYNTSLHRGSSQGVHAHMPPSLGLRLHKFSKLELHPTSWNMLGPDS